MRYITVETEALNRLLRSNKDLAKRLEGIVDRLDRLMEVNSSLPSNVEAFDWVDDTFLCERLKFSPYLIKRMREDGTLPYSNLGGRNFYRLNEILKKNMNGKMTKCKV